MATRSAVGLALALVTALVVVAPGAAREPSDDLSAAELCALFPQDQGFAFTEAPGLNKCQASRGDCDQAAADTTTCVSGIILQKSTPQEAREMIPAPGDGTWKTVSGLGETAVGRCERFWCEVRLQRDRFWLSAMVAPGLGLEAARQLAARVDQEIERLLGSRSEPEERSPEPESPPSDPAGGEAGGPGSSDALVDVFFGTRGIKALIPDIRKVLDCRGIRPDDIVAGGIFVCRGARPVLGVIGAIYEGFQADFPTPTQRQRDGIEAYVTAVSLAGFTAEDGTALFPSVRAAMPLIRRLSNPVAAKRFVEMLAARDAADW